MLEPYPFAPIAGHIRIGTAIWSYCGTLYLGVTGDRESVSDLNTLVRGINCGSRACWTEQPASWAETQGPVPEADLGGRDA